MNHSNLEELLHKFAAGKINPAELAALQQLMADDAAADAIDIFLQKAYNDPSLAINNDFEKQEAFKHIERHLKLSSKATVKHLYTKKRAMYTWWRTIAAVLVAGGFLVYFFLQTKPGQGYKEVAATAMDNEDVHAPKTNRATITMSDGRVMYLDSAGNGQLATQEATRLIKLSNGVIAYEISGQKSQPIAPAYNTVTNPRGSRVINIILSDGSKVWLNAGSSITYPVAFTTDERLVQLEGEGYFEVSPSVGPFKGSEKKKFIVIANNVRTEVLGTHFNINAYKDEGDVKVTLLEGRVDVQIAGVQNKAMLTPGMQARAAGNELHTVRNIDVSSQTAWKDGYFSFHHADIKEVLRQLARWYDLTVEYRGNIPHREFEGEMQQDLVLSQALKILEKNKVNFKTEGRKIIIMP